jgi:hypothetical protein
MAESTGRLPPTPVDHAPAREVKAMKFDDPPAATAKTPVIRRVTLKDILRICIVKARRNFTGHWNPYLRPQISAPTPQNTAPIRRPTFCPSLRKGPLNENSLTTAGRMSPVTILARFIISIGVRSNGVRILAHGPKVIPASRTACEVD